MRSSRNIFSNVDKLTLLFYVLLVFIGWISIYAAVYNEEHHSIFDISQRYGLQLVWIAAAILIALVILLLEGTFFTTFAYPIFIIVMLTLVAVLLFGAEVNGSKSWFKIGGFQLQPSEFAKFATVLALSKYLSTLNIKMKDIKTKVIAMCIIGIPAALILLQNDTGSTLVYAAFIFVLYREGLSGNILLFGVLAIIIFVLTLVFGPINIILTVTFFSIVFYTLFKYDIKTTLTSVTLYLASLFTFYYFKLDEVFIYYILGSLLFFFLLVLMVKKEIKDRTTHFFAIVIFLFIGLYIFSIDFAFNKVLQEHQRTRITVLLGEEDKLLEQIEELKLELEDDKIKKEEKLAIKEDLKVKKSSLKDLRQGNGWNIKQSLIAIGSGGFTGKGFLEGTQTKFDFVPEQSTDFIFCTIGEEWGFLGSFVLICLYVGLFLRIIFLAERQRSIFSRIYGYSVASILFFHFLVNIGMAIGLAPVIGISLPFISYGGSSLWSFTILLFIFIKLDAERMNVLR